MEEDALETLNKEIHVQIIQKKSSTLSLEHKNLTCFVIGN
jgi:hypothetical protein